MSSVNQYPTRTLLQLYNDSSNHKPLRAVPSLKELPSTNYNSIQKQTSLSKNYASHKNLHENQSLNLQDVSSISKITTDQDKYLRNLNMNRRKKLEYQEKQQKEMLKVLQLKQSQSTSKLFRKIPAVYDREPLPGVTKFISDKKYSHDQSVNSSSLLNSKRKQKSSKYIGGSGSKGGVETDDEWQLRLKLIDKLSSIQQRNRQYFRGIEDEYETETQLKSKQYFSNAIRDKIESQYNDLPASLVALSQNRQYILDQLINKKGFDIISGGLAAVNTQQQSHNHTTTNAPKSSFISATESDKKKSTFLANLRKQSIKKFKDRFMDEEYIQRKLQQQKLYVSRSQYDNAGNQFRFLPPDRQRKIENNIKIIIDQKSREREMEKCLDKCIRGSDYNTDEEEMAAAAKFKKEGYIIGSIHQNQ